MSNELKLKVVDTQPKDTGRGYARSNVADMLKLNLAVGNILKSVDFSLMNEALASYHEVIGLPVSIIDFNGIVLASSNWQRIGMEFHHVNQGILTHCLKSDRSLSRQMQEGKNYAIYSCPNGLTDCASPIFIEGQHIANLFIGQFFLKPPELEEFEAQCAEFGFDHDNYFQALAKVPIVEEEKIPAIRKMLVSFANQIAKQSIAEHRAKITYESIEKQVVERTQLLSDALNFNDTVLLNSPLPMSVWAANGQCVFANDAYAKLVGATHETLLTQNFNQITAWKESGWHDDCLKSLVDFNSRHGEIHDASLFGKEIWIEYQLTPTKLHSSDHLIMQFVDLTERKKLEDELRHYYAFHDSLTGLPNRRLLLDRIEQAMRTSKSQNCYFAVLFLDLNKFKQLNDLHGHDVGDQWLIEVAHRLLKLVRETDTLARIAGDEFVVLLEGLDAEAYKASEQASAVVDKIHTGLSAEYVLGDIRHHGSTSVGIKLFHGNGVDPEQILRDADAAMYAQKNRAVR